MQLLRFHYRKFFFFMVIFITVALLVLSQYSSNSKQDFGTEKNKYHKTASKLSHVIRPTIKVDVPHLSHHTSIDRLQALRLSNLFHNLSQEGKCPVCLGTDLCEDVSSGFLTLTSETGRVDVTTGAVYYSANIGIEHSVRVQVLNESVLQRVESVLCGASASQCGVKGAAVRWPYITSVEALTTTVLRQFLTAVGASPYTHPILMCPSPLSLAVLEASFTSDPVSAGTGVPTPAEKVNLLTALAAAPGYMVQKMADRLQLSPASISMLGACGRTWVGGREELTSLSSMMGEHWEVRAALGAQLLGVVEDMLESSEEWLVFVSKWTVEQLAVTSEGELLLRDASHAVIIDKSVLRVGAAGEYGGENDFDTLGETCNRDCFQRLLRPVVTSQLPLPSSRPDAGVDAVPGEYFKPSLDKTIFNNVQRVKRGVQLECANEDLFAHIMYVSVCAFVLSDDKAHTHIKYFPELHGGQHVNERHQGLLHSAPPAVAPRLKDLVASCVIERGGGTRLRAVEELKELLGEEGGLSAEGGNVDYEDDEEDEGGEDVEEQEGAAAGPRDIQSRIKQFEQAEKNKSLRRGL